MPRERAYGGAAAVGPYIYVAGGGDAGEHLRDAWRIDTRTGHWARVRALTWAGLCALSCVRCVVAGGRHRMAHVEGSRLTPYPPTHTRTPPSLPRAPQLPDMSVQRMSFTCGEIGGRIYVAGGGGGNGKSWYATVEALDPEAGVWLAGASAAAQCTCRSLPTA